MTATLDISAVADAVASATGPAPVPGPLPSGWILRESHSNPGYHYYYNMENGLTTWQPPVTDQPSNPSHDEHMEEKTEETPQPQEIKQAEQASEEKDPEVAEDRSSKRRKAPAAASGAPKEVRVLHILKKHAGSRRPSSWRQAKITATFEEAKEELQGLLEILLEEEGNPEELRATFEELARTESDCSSAKRGGDLGFFGRRKMQPAFEESSFGLKLGELTHDIVETSSGAHLILRIG